MHPFFDLPNPAIFGHRGAAGNAPENTLFAFQTGLDLGADVLESDIHLSRDGVPVLIHDPDVDRTTDGHGAVADLELAELMTLDAGYRFAGATAGHFPFRGRDLRIASLETAFADFPRARFNLELKGGGERLASEVVRLVEKFDRPSRTLLTAGDDLQMVQLRSAIDDAGCAVATGACTSDAAGFARAALEDSPPPPGVMALQVPAFFGSTPLVTVAFVTFAHSHGVPVHVWTIDDEAEMESLLDLGVDGLITDYPGRMKAVLDRRGAQSES